MPDPITLGMLTGLAVSKLIENKVNDFTDTFKTLTGKAIHKTQIKSCVRQLQKHAEAARKVKTLWQVDKAVDLLDFYCQSHIVTRLRDSQGAQKKVRRPVSSVDDFGTKRSVLVQGIAGQGKSILLRYLCSIELAKASRIPILIELHKLQPDESLKEHIKHFLSYLKFPQVDDDVIFKLCETNKLRFFLDGFDEIPEERRSAVISEFERMDSVAPGSFVISSRPDSGIEMSPLVDVVRLDNLRDEEYQAVIKKISENEKYAGSLISSIKKHKGGIKELLCTPLLVTLLVLSYKSYQELPSQLSDFYERIFQDLLQRHDGTKPGFHRKRSCKINDAQYRQIFDCLCYYSKQAKEGSFKYSALQEIAKSAISKCDIKADVQEYLNDAFKVTCLLLREGDDCRFIHKSLQEYYAASYVRSRSAVAAEKFYAYCLEPRIGSSWSQELMYLMEIDPYRCRKYYELPRLCRILKVTPETLPATVPKADLTSVIELIGALEIGFTCETDEEPNINARAARNTGHLGAPLHLVIFNLFRLDFSQVVEAIKKSRLSPVVVKDSKPFTFQYVKIADIVKSGLLCDELTNVVQEIFDDSLKQALKAHAFIVREDSCDMRTPLI